MRSWPRPAVGNAVVPVFPRYVFASLHLPTHYFRVSFSPGVKNFVHVEHDAPAVVPPEVIAAIKEREGPDGLLCYERAHAPGTRLRIFRGPLKDVCGVLQTRLSSRDRAVLLIDFLHRQIRVEVSGRWLTRA
jgi:transcription antitermination factor NusG